MIKTQKLKVKTKGYCDIVDITEQVGETIAKSNISNGTITVFNVDSTG